MKLSIKYLAACATVAAIIAPARLEAAEVRQEVQLPVKANLTIDETDCHNSGGPQVTLEGVINLGNVCVKVTLSNNKKGTHTTTVLKEYKVSLALDKSITIPKQPVRGGVGGNPHIWLQFTDGSGGSLSDEIYLGRCVQGLNVSRNLLNEAILKALIEAGGCSNSGGPSITIGGELVLSGLNAKIIFRNNAKGTHEAEAITNVSLIAQGTKIVLPKQPSRGGVGGNPIISVQFVNCRTGAALGDPIVLGRCNKI